MIGFGSYLPRLWNLNASSDGWLPIGDVPASSGSCGWVLHQSSSAELQSPLNEYDGMTNLIEPGETLLTVERNGLEIWAGIVDTVDIDEEAAILTVTASDFLTELAHLVVRDLLDTAAGGEKVEAHAEALVRSAITGAPQFAQVAILATGGPNLVSRVVSPSTPVYALDQMQELADLGLDFFAIGRNIILQNRPDTPTAPAFTLAANSSWVRKPVVRRTRAGYADVVWGTQGEQVVTLPTFPPADRALVELISPVQNVGSELDSYTASVLGQVTQSRTLVVPAGPLAPTAALDIQDLTPATVGTILAANGSTPVRSLEVKFSWEDGRDNPLSGKTGVEVVLGVPVAPPYRVSLISPEGTQASILANVEDRLRKLENRSNAR